MNTVVIVILVIMAIIVLGVICYILTYNRIQKNLVRINEAESQIDDTLRKKYDILAQMENVINEKTDLKQNNFEEFKAEDLKITNFDVDRKLTKIEDTFNKIKSDYNEALDVESFNNLLVDLKSNGEKCDASKAYYNTYTTKLNMLIKKFPSNIVARVHGIKEHLYFDNKNMNDEDIFDFKL